MARVGRQSQPSSKVRGPDPVECLISGVQKFVSDGALAEVTIVKVKDFLYVFMLARSA